MTLIRYGLVYGFRHRIYKPENTCFNFVDVIVDSHHVINKNYTKTAFSNCEKSDIRLRYLK